MQGFFINFVKKTPNSRFFAKIRDSSKTRENRRAKHPEKWRVLSVFWRVIPFCGI